MDFNAESFSFDDKCRVTLAPGNGRATAESGSQGQEYTGIYTRNHGIVALSTFREGLENIFIFYRGL